MRKPRRWIERLPLRCNDVDQIAMAHEYGFVGYLQRLANGPTAKQRDYEAFLHARVYLIRVADPTTWSRVC